MLFRLVLIINCIVIISKLLGYTTIAWEVILIPLGICVFCELVTKYTEKTIKKYLIIENIRNKILIALLELFNLGVFSLLVYLYYKYV